jgi:hypothetical protein
VPAWPLVPLEPDVPLDPEGPASIYPNEMFVTPSFRPYGIIDKLY